MMNQRVAASNVAMIVRWESWLGLTKVAADSLEISWLYGLVFSSFMRSDTAGMIYHHRWLTAQCAYNLALNCLPISHSIHFCCITWLFYTIHMSNIEHLWCWFVSYISFSCCTDIKVSIFWPNSNCLHMLDGKAPSLLRFIIYLPIKFISSK